MSFRTSHRPQGVGRSYMPTGTLAMISRVRAHVSFSSPTLISVATRARVMRGTVLCASGALVRNGAAMKWVTRPRPKTDRIACPWLIQRFIDPDAEILYVPKGDVLAVAASRPGSGASRGDRSRGGRRQ